MRWLLGIALVGFVAAGCTPLPTNPVDDGLAAAPAVSPTTLPSGALHFSGIRYGTADGYQTLDLYRPASGGPFPLVVWYHGGAWTQGSRMDLPSGYRDALLAAGYAVATADYRLVHVEGLQVANPWPTGLLDAKLAVKYLRTFAGLLALDGTRIVTSGHSAGGHLAVMVAISRGAAGVSLPGGDPAVNGAVVFGAPMDIPRAMNDFPASVIANIPVRLLMGCGLDGSYCDTKRMQPPELLDANDPPVRLVDSTGDPVVPPSDASVMQARATQVGYSRLTTDVLGGLDHDGVNAYAPTSSFLPWLASVI